MIKLLSTTGLLVLGLVSVRGLLQAQPCCGKETEFTGITLRCTAEISGVVIKYKILIYYLLFFLFFFGFTKGVFCVSWVVTSFLLCVCALRFQAEGLFAGRRDPFPLPVSQRLTSPSRAEADRGGRRQSRKGTPSPSFSRRLPPSTSAARLSSLSRKSPECFSHSVSLS